MQICASSGMRWCSGRISRRSSIPTSGRWRCNAHITARCGPLLFLAYDESQSLCGVASLAAGVEGRVSFLCATTGDYCDFIGLPEHKACLRCRSAGRVEEARHRRHYAHEPAGRLQYGCCHPRRHRRRPATFTLRARLTTVLRFPWRNSSAGRAKTSPYCRGRRCCADF